MASVRYSTKARVCHNRHSSLGERNGGWYGNASRYSAGISPKRSRREMSRAIVRMLAAGKRDVEQTTRRALVSRNMAGTEPAQGCSVASEPTDTRLRDEVTRAQDLLPSVGWAAQAWMPSRF